VTRPGSPDKPRLLLLGRQGCHLCDELEDELLEHFGPGQFQIDHADVDSRPDWREAFGSKIPVLLDEHGAVICETRFDVRAFRNILGA
jgi:hypothetical protein